MVREIVVENPMECVFNSECRCSLNDVVEGICADECPEGGYPNFEFPVNCPLTGNDYLIKKGLA